MSLYRTGLAWGKNGLQVGSRVLDLLRQKQKPSKLYRTLYLISRHFHIPVNRQEAMSVPPAFILLSNVLELT